MTDDHGALGKGSPIWVLSDLSGNCTFYPHNPLTPSTSFEAIILRERVNDGEKKIFQYIQFLQTNITVRHRRCVSEFSTKKKCAF